MRFTIRDLLWLTGLVAVIVGWAIDHSQLSGPARETSSWKAKHDKAVEQLNQMQSRESAQLRQILCLEEIAASEGWEVKYGDRGGTYARHAASGATVGGGEWGEKEPIFGRSNR
jgi:hypothetical protein